MGCDTPERLIEEDESFLGPDLNGALNCLAETHEKHHLFQSLDKELFVVMRDEFQSMGLGGLGGVEVRREYFELWWKYKRSLSESLWQQSLDSARPATSRRDTGSPESDHSMDHTAIGTMPEFTAGAG